MGFYEDMERRYAGVFKAVEDDDQRCCEYPTCWTGVVWDLMQAAAKIKLQELYIERLEVNAKPMQDGGQA